LAVVPDLTEQDLEKLGLSLGHRRKFLGDASREPLLHRAVAGSL
jgi:hypothetical protein